MFRITFNHFLNPTLHVDFVSSIRCLQM